MNIALWMLQGVVAISFLFHGWLYQFVPPCATEMITSVGLAPRFRRCIGGAEVPAAAGLILVTVVATMRWVVAPF